MDWIRSAYATKMRFSDDPLAPLVDVQWYFVDDVPSDQVRWFPGPTVFCSSNWETNRDVPDFQGTGEVFPDFPRRPWRNGRRPWRGNRNAPCGTPSQFLGFNAWPWVQEPVDGENRPVCCNAGQAAFAGLHAELSIKATVTYAPAGVPCISCGPHTTPLVMHVQGYGWAGSLAWGWESSGLNGLDIECTQSDRNPCIWRSDPILIPPFPGSVKPPFHVRFEVGFLPFTNTARVNHFAIEPTFFFDGEWSKTDPGITCCPLNVLPKTEQFPFFVTFPNFVAVACSSAGLPPHHSTSTGRLHKLASLTSVVSYVRGHIVSALAKTLSMSSVVTYVPVPNITVNVQLKKTLSIRTVLVRYAPNTILARSLLKKLSMSSVVTYP